jgi:uncharacterized membrane protein YfcA
VPGNLSGLELGLLLLSVAVGVTIQGSIGFGYALVSAPVLALALPEALPATFIILAFPLTTVMALRERHAIDVRGFAWITAGRVLGTAAGAAILVAVPSDSLSVLFGALIILAVGLSTLGPGVEARSRTRFVAGIASGTMGTAAAIGGPALALVYQGRPGPELRSTLALSFEAGQVLALGALMIAGQVHVWHLVLAAELLPAMALGLLVGPFVARRVDRRWLRPAVLAFAGTAGVAAIVKGLVG